MSHQFLHRWEVHTHHHQTARKGVLRVIEREFSRPSLRPASSHAERKERLGSTFVAAEDQTICQRIHSNCLQRYRQHVVHGHQQFLFWNSTGIELRGEFKTPEHAIHCSQQSQTLSCLTAWRAWQNAWRCHASYSARHFHTVWVML
jgi:hypothetical protein